VPASIHVAHLQVHPVKGMGPWPLQVLDLEAGRAVPGDRLFGIVRPEALRRRAPDEWLPPEAFHMLMNSGDERLAGLRARVVSSSLEVRVREHVVLVADLDSGDGRARIAEFIGRTLGLPREGGPRLVRAVELGYDDLGAEGRQGRARVHVLNLASVRDLEDRAGTPVDPGRFRAAVHLDGAAAWDELSWVGSTVRAGSAVLRVTRLTERCSATEVDPRRGVRDLPVPRLLRRHLGHAHLGFYAEVVTRGVVRPGDAVEVRGE
jgi:uncharacterized protein YcbX